MNLRGKKVLVTGACGFIGSHLAEYLLEQGCEVKAFVFYNSFNSYGWLDSIPEQKIKEMNIIAGDIRDFGGIRLAVEGADIVFHLAALIGIPFSYRSPESYVETNINGTLNVLQACKEHSTKKLIITSTSEVYGSALHVPIDESHPLQGQSPYSASKISADKMAESFYRSFDIPIAVARPFNTYGPRQSARAIIPAIIIQLLSGNKKCKVGSLEPIRDFVYIKDTVEGFAAIARSDNTVGETINIASQSGISIGDLAKKIIKMIKPGASLMFDKKRVRPKNSEVKRLLGSRKKIAELTGWKTFYTLDEGLEETIDWFRDNLNKYKTDAYNI